MDHNLIVVGPSTEKETIAEYRIIDTTFKSATKSKYLDPACIGPINLYQDYTSRNLFNAFEFAKCYQEHDDDGKPNIDYFIWAQNGWDNKYAQRYPMGKGAKPLYLFWDGALLSYIEARKKVYVPLYANAVIKTEAFQILKNLYDSKKEKLALWDFDGYNHLEENLTLRQVINNPDKKMGHAFILFALLENWVDE